MTAKEQLFEERLAKFATEVIVLCKSIHQDAINRPIISQLIRSATSIGTNYSEANNACSKADFKNKIYICKKESQETKYWLKLLKSCIEKQENINILWQECHEFSLIFQKIVSTLSIKNDK